MRKDPISAALVSHLRTTLIINGSDNLVKLSSLHSLALQVRSHFSDPRLDQPLTHRQVNQHQSQIKHFGIQR